ncbi:MAG: AMP-binding protein, partial [Halobacteria archaeon]|nr:AMP-binding protein [Halobacteria archaeon]
MTDKPWHEVYGIQHVASETWHEVYDDFGIPESLEPYPEKPGHSFLREAAESHPSMGLVQPGRSVDYADADDAADALAAELRESGVEKGDKVVSILPTSTEFVITVNAVSKAGGINVPVDPIES